MSPEYLEKLADLADPNEVWRRAFPLQDLTSEERRQVDTGVALRRYADHIRRLLGLMAEGRSLLITPLSANGSAFKSVATPPDHARLREARSSYEEESP